MFDDIKSEIAKVAADAHAHVDSVVHDIFAGLEALANHAVVATAAVADKTGAAANTLNAAEAAKKAAEAAQAAADNSADSLNAAEAAANAAQPAI